MENTARKLFAIFGILLLLSFALFIFVNNNVFADNEVSYLKYNTSTKEFETKTLSNYTPIETTTVFSAGGTFVLDDDVTLDAQIDCGTNNLTLILCDGKTLTVDGIKCKDLTIYAQELGTGKIAAKDDNDAGTFIKCSGTLDIHGGEITTGDYYINRLIDCTRAMTIYSGKFSGNVDTGIFGRLTLSIENAIVDLVVETYGIYSRQALIINNGTYNIDAANATYGTAICSDYARITINNGTYDFNDINIGFYADQELIINHGKISIVSSNNAFVSENKTIFIRGTVTAHSEDYPVAQAAKTITVSYANMLCTTNSPDKGVFHSDSVSTGSENVDLYYKYNEEDEWFSDYHTGPNTNTVKFLKVVPVYNHITIWVEDISVEKGADISLIDIPFSFGYYDRHDEDTQDDYRDVFDLAATLISVTVNCDGTTPGTYDYELVFAPEYEGNIDDHYEIVFADEVGHFIVTAPVPASVPDTDTEQQGSGNVDPPTPNANTAEENEEGFEEIEEFWAKYGCIGLVVVIIDLFMLFDWAFVILYLLQNKKHPNDKSILASKISRHVGLFLSICALIFAIVVIIIHQCTFATLGIIGAAIVVALFGASYLVRFEKNQ